MFILAPLLSTAPAKDYYASKETWTYFWRGMTLFNGIRYALPGVFETNPLKGEFNGSLWTLPVELRMYMFCAVGWLAFSWRPALRVPALKIVAPIAALFLYVSILQHYSEGVAVNNVDIAIFMFFMGATLYFWRDKVSLSWASSHCAAASGRGGCGGRPGPRLRGLFVMLRPVPLASRLSPKRKDPQDQRLGRLLLRHLYLRFSRSADTGAFFSRHALGRNGPRLGRDRVGDRLVLVAAR